MIPQVAEIKDKLSKSWTETSLRIKTKWSELTDDDIWYIAWSTERLSEKLKERCQDKKRDIQKEVNTFIESL